MTFYKYFMRVHVKLEDDDELGAHLAFDFRTSEEAAKFATAAYMAGDINKVWIEFVENEIDTTNSPMWRDV